MSDGCCGPTDTCKSTINVGGMTCGHCAGIVEAAIKKIPGVIKVDVDLEGKKVDIEYTGESANVESFIEAVNDAGYQGSA